MNRSNAPLATAWDAIIVGAGPVGLMLANLLGVHGVRTLVIERNAKLEAEPRAVTIDDESLRTCQQAGLIDTVMKDIVPGYGVQYFDWRGKPFASIQPTREEYGYPKRNAFRQPLFVAALLEGLGRFNHVDVRFGHTLLDVVQPGDPARPAHCTLGREGGSTVGVDAGWVVGCDGARSRLREIAGSALDGSTLPQRWLIVDLAQRRLALRDTRTFCDPRRPAIRLPGPHGTLRYEFMLRAGDVDDAVLDERIWRQWLADRMPEDADLPLVRKAVYGFHARVANRWKQGRILLAGDAAHLTPPFAGQGVNSGIRDAANLAWKIAAVTRWGFDASLIDSYEPERKPHAAALIRMAMRIGDFMQPASIPGAMLAQTALRLACLVPWCRDYILQLRFKPKPHFAEGWFERSTGATHSQLVPQPFVQHPVKGRVLLDTLIGDGFVVIGWDSPAFLAAALGLLPAGMPGRALALIRRGDDFLGPEPQTRDGEPAIERIRDPGGTLDALLDARSAAALVIRPDRYTWRFASSADLETLAATAPVAAPSSSILQQEILGAPG